MNLTDIFDQTVLTEGRYDPNVFKCIFVAGAPGSGKTTIEHRLGLQSLGLKILDVDQTLRYLNELQKEKPDYDRANQVNTKRMDIWIQNHLGLVVQATGRNEAPIIQLNKQLKNSYYDSFMIMVQADEDIARSRVISRPSLSNRPHDKGRRVDMDYFDEAYKAVMRNVELYEQIFGDSFANINNNDTSEDEQSFQEARAKLAAFLKAQVSPEASNFLKGVKTHQRASLGRKYALPTAV